MSSLMPSQKVSVVSVVRDFDMYGRCVSGNPFLEGCELVPVDNRSENLPVTKRYNDYLDSVHDDRWIVFCHEDWEVREPLLPVLEKLDRGFLYGPIGVFVEERRRSDVMIMRGGVEQSAKDGRRQVVIRGKDPSGRVDTFDCQCLIVHSSLVRMHHLRFDPHLCFDMYVEDFCVAAFENAGIQSIAVELKCHHHSRGSLSASFRDSLEYVRRKYASSRKRYATIVGHLNTFGGDSSRNVYKWKRIPWVMLRYRFSK